jgi:hypothetical protein
MITLRQRIEYLNDILSEFDALINKYLNFVNVYHVFKYSEILNKYCLEFYTVKTNNIVYSYSWKTLDNLRDDRSYKCNLIRYLFSIVYGISKEIFLTDEYKEIMTRIDIFLKSSSIEETDLKLHIMGYS